MTSKQWPWVDPSEVLRILSPGGTASGAEAAKFWSLVWGDAVTLRFFDFSEEIDRALHRAKDDVSRLSARTEIGREMFPGAVARAGFRLMSVGEAFFASNDERVLVVGVATWSDPDLDALETLTQHTRGRPMRVLVFDVDNWGLEDILRTFPGMPKIRATPLVLQYNFGALAFAGDGREAIYWLGQI